MLLLTSTPLITKVTLPRPWPLTVTLWTVYAHCWGGPCYRPLSRSATISFSYVNLRNVLLLVATCCVMCTYWYWRFRSIVVAKSPLILRCWTRRVSLTILFRPLPSTAVLHQWRLGNFFFSTWVLKIGLNRPPIGLERGFTKFKSTDDKYTINCTYEDINIPSSFLAT
jgi:hypothetical protein